ncbi:hypothetical protein CC1G_09780 [Coprinopsis cinerea okayama7|uniref:Uncharacterized protein n=1 Tax=Coprinopsis cinerea (strain Okayama-7 / 130 / ATCC MYA-4618 / FGSC 9003) TaxID=240176 RepID=A8PE50_COPC7|nr:hypothetical protein CC1G_09780 [Coprinopsis cinerea okayama7\|eukprot:XP_001840729.2 hypothetical protein CC1G_09780 [Coprinopsis cinerea okayama7\
MNVHYPASSAAVELEKIAMERTEHRLVGLQLGDFDPKRLRTEMTMSYFENDKTWRIVEKVDEDMSTNEVVWHVQGALSKKDLPPFDTNIRANIKAKARYLRQGVTIEGFNTPSFLRAIENISEIHSLFSRCVKQGTLIPSEIVTVNPGGGTMAASNRYFTSRTDDPQGQAHILGSTIDPNGTLAEVAGDQYFYGEDNVVCYLEKVETSDAGVSLQCRDVSPVKIREGDLVEIQVTFMLVPIRGQKWKMNAVLRCITIMDTSFTLEAIRRSSASMPRIALVNRMRLKRRIGKDIEDEPQEDAPINKLQRMNVDG